MELAHISRIGGLESKSTGLIAGGIDDIGSFVVDVADLPTPDLALFPMLTFTAPASGALNVQFGVTGTTGGIHWGDGTPVFLTPNHSYTGLTPGEQITINTGNIIDNTFTLRKNVPTAGYNDFENLTFWWSNIRDSKANLNLKDLLITKREMDPNMDGSFSNINLTGNRIPGKFPSGITATGSLFIANNHFVGDLPTPQLSTIVNYVIKENGFRGAIHDISASTNIKRYSAYGQDDGITGTIRNPRIMLTGQIPRLSSLSNLVYYHVGNGGVTEYNKGLANKLTVDPNFQVNQKIEEFYAGTCGLSQADVDLILERFYNKIPVFENPIRISVGGGNAEPSAQGMIYKSALQSAGWDVITAPDF